MKGRVRLLLGFCALLGASGLTPAPARNPVSSRVIEVEAALRDWVAAGAKGDAPLPVHLRGAVQNLPPAGAAPAPGQEPELRLLVRTDDASALRRAGFHVGTVAGRVATVTAPLGRVRELGAVSGVRSVEFPRRLKPLLDVSVPEIRADDVHGSVAPPYPGSTGEGIVVGVVDTGIDFDHPDFVQSNGTRRITRIWDQEDNVGPHPSGYNYGSEWTAASIQNGTARERDNDGHGTHVTGIAAGNGRGGPNPYAFTGTAPEAEILFVKTDFTEDGLIDGLAWIQSHAGAKPCVINMSLGSQFGGHDGTSTLDVAMEGLSGPGRLLVAAAGNEGSSDIHAQASVNSGATVQVNFQVDPFTPNGGINNDVILIDGWATANANFAVSVITPNLTTVGPVTTGPTQQVTAQGTVRIEQITSPDNGDKNLLIDIYDSNGVPPASGTWKVQLTNNAAGSREMDLWVSLAVLGGGANVAWTSFVDNTELVTSPASSDSVIAVGAYVTKVLWDCVADTDPCGYTQPPVVGSAPAFSSPGPLRDGTAKPEISAPGMGIGSSLSSDASSPLFTNAFAILTGGAHYVSQGTSQASPHVAGVVALMLENAPTLAKEDVTLTLIATARHDGFTGGGFHNQFGNGKIDALEAVSQVTPVVLLSFVAGWEGDQAVLRWELGETEEGTTFRIERGVSPQGPFTAVSGVLQGGLSFAWTDPAPDAAAPWYRLVQTGRDGASSALGVVRLDAPVPRLRLWPNAPNPFATTTVIAYELERAGTVRLEVLDVSGRTVAVLASGPASAGRREARWDGTGPGGKPAASGIYFLRLIAPDGAELGRRMVLAR
jgi:subtilisin family serine protease